MSFFGRAIAARLANLWRDSDMAKKRSDPPPEPEAYTPGPHPNWQGNDEPPLEPPPVEEPKPKDVPPIGEPPGGGPPTGGGPGGGPPSPPSTPPETAAGASHRGGGVTADAGAQMPGPWQNPGRVYPVSPPPAHWPGL